MSAPSASDKHDRMQRRLPRLSAPACLFRPALDPRFEEALRHVLDHPGSLVRPRMVLLVATAYELDDAAAQDLAIALEYFHTASLIFDDLPCMDNAMERRGVPCVHFEFGEAEAILSALALDQSRLRVDLARQFPRPRRNLSSAQWLTSSSFLACMDC